MVRACCVLGCPSGANMPSHKFPKNPDQFKIWKATVWSPKLSNLSDSTLQKCTVCFRHFEDSDYIVGHRLRKLKENVAPSVNLPTVYAFNEEADEIVQENIMSLNSVDHLETDYNMQENDISVNSVDSIETDSNMQESVMSVNSVDSADNIRTDCNTQMGVNESDGNEELFKPTTPKRQKLELLEKNWKSANLTPNASRLYSIAKSLRRRQISTMSKMMSFKQRLREAEKYSKTQAIQTLMSSVSPTQRRFIQMQMRTAKYAPRGRRFTLDEKILALSLYKQSGACYKLLRKMFNLPSVKTLRSMLAKISIGTGVNTFLTDYLKEQVEEMHSNDKLCCLMWDEMSLQSHLDYNKISDQIAGFEDYNTVRRAKFADHALVFMLRGIRTGWKFPLAYYFCDSQTKSDQLVKCIKEVTANIIQCGLTPVTFVCDQAKTNVSAINKLKFDTMRSEWKKGRHCKGIIKLYGQDIIPLYDPPHLIKGVRNNLLNKDLEVECKVSKEEDRKFLSWEIIELAYKMDYHGDNLYRMLPKLTAEHVIEKRIKKMRVKNAVQILSKTVSGFIHHHTRLEGHINTEHGQLSMPKKEGEVTAKALLFFNDLFDSVNGHTLKPETPLRVVVSDHSPHTSFWRSAVAQLREMQYVDCKTKKPTKRATCLRNWILTIQGFQKLWKSLKNAGLKNFKPRMINQDSLENFFGLIRSLGHRNTNPTCIQFESSFKTLLINNLTSRHAVGSNCESKCDGDLLFTLKKFLRQTEHIETTSNDYIDPLIVEDISCQKKAVARFRNVAATKFTKKLCNNPEIANCKFCNDVLFSNTGTGELQKLHRNWIQLFDNAVTVLNEQLPTACYCKNLRIRLETVLYVNLELSWISCATHSSKLKESLINFTSEHEINMWCKKINQILCGKARFNTDRSFIIKQAFRKFNATHNKARKT